MQLSLREALRITQQSPNFITDVEDSIEQGVSNDSFFMVSSRGMSRSTLLPGGAVCLLS